MKKPKPTKMTMAEAFDEWQRRYEENPDEFCNEMQMSKAHRRKSRGSKASEAGNTCAALLRRIMRSGKAAWDA